MFDILRWLFGSRQPAEPSVPLPIPVRRRERWNGDIVSPVQPGPVANSSTVLRGIGLESWDGRCPDCGHADFAEAVTFPSVVSTCKRCGTRVNGVQQADGSWLAQRI